MKLFISDIDPYVLSPFKKKIHLMLYREHQEYLSFTISGFRLTEGLLNIYFITIHKFSSAS